MRSVDGAERNVPMSVEPSAHSAAELERRGVVSSNWPAPPNGLIWMFETIYAYRPDTRRWRWIARCSGKVRRGKWQMTEAEAVEAALRAGANHVRRPPDVHGFEGSLR